MQVKKYQKNQKLRTGIKLGRKARKRLENGLVNTSHIPWISRPIQPATRKTGTHD